MSSELSLEEKSDHEKCDIIEEKQCSSTALDETELTEPHSNCHLSQDKRDTESLESIQNYAQRIKSFLGWESNQEEQEIENERETREEINRRAVDGNAAQNLFSASTDIGEGIEIPKEKLNCFYVTSNDENAHLKKSENTKDCTQYDENLNITISDETTQVSFQRSEEKYSQVKYNEQNITQNEQKTEMDFDNHNNNNLHSENDTVRITNIISDSADVNNDVADCLKNEATSAGTPSSKSSDSYITQEGRKMNDSLADEVITDRETLHLNTAMKNTASITAESNKIVESQANDTTVSPLDSKEYMELNEYILSESERNDHRHECLNDNNNKSERNKNGSSDLETKDLMPVDKDKEEPNSSQLKTDVIRNNSNLPSENIEDSKKGNENTISEALFSEVIVPGTETDQSLKYKKDINSNAQSKELEYYESPTTANETESDYADDLRSEDSLDLDETFSLNTDLPKHYVKEIRRLSRDIVRDVIQSARSSVHELYASKPENLDIGSQSESATNYYQIKDTQEFYFINGNKQEEETAEFDEQFSKEKYEKNSGNANNFMEQKQNTEDSDTFCGFACFKPQWIQKYATPRAYLVLFSIIGVIHGGYYPYVVSIISTLEKRYAFKTKVSGTLLLADEITPLILGILVGYIGGKTHRPRMVALGMFLSATCCFVSGLPYLIYGTAKHTLYSDGNNKPGPKICDSVSKSTHCNTDDQPPTLSVVGIFLLASFLKGFATLSYYVIGISYMDDIIKRKNSPMYLAISLALRLVGPLFGFLMSSGFLKFYENPLYDPGFGPDDPRWIGAWWIGFFLQGILLTIFTIPIALFPRRLPSQRKIEKIADTCSEGGFKVLFKDCISALKRLLTNPVFIVLIINTNMVIFGHFGPGIMLPKYMENQFKLSASQASLFSGALTVCCVIISTLLGGFVIWKYRPRIKVVLGGMIACEIILCVGFLILMIPRCQLSEMSHFGVNDDGLILNSICNKHCDCTTSSYTPFCGQDGKTLYFSPCHAGCTEEVTSSTSPNTKKKFGNCSCVDQQQLGTTISEGVCPDENCWSQMLAYLLIYMFLVSVSNFFTVASTMILLRSVHPNDKSIALGTFETFICLFGFIPFPVTFGALVDSACLVWEKSCGETGNCWFYDMEKYAYLLHGTSALFCSLSVVCLIILYFLSPRIRNLYDEEDEKEDNGYVDIKLDTVYGSVTKL